MCERFWERGVSRDMEIFVTTGKFQSPTAFGEIFRSGAWFRPSQRFPKCSTGALALAEYHPTFAFRDGTMVLMLSENLSPAWLFSAVVHCILLGVYY